MNRFKLLIGVAVASVALTACSGGDTKDETVGAEVQVPSGNTAPDPNAQGDRLTGLNDPSRSGGSELDDPASLLSQRVLYFDFDSFEVASADRPIIEAHAGYLAQNPSATLTLEGHADERGTREYNIALGEKRALGVRRLMGALGGTDPQLNTVSFGEERPAIPGHNESSWSKNRRVEIVYLTQ